MKKWKCLCLFHTLKQTVLFSLSDMIRTGNSSSCKFGENCTFGYNQLEIDVWTMERNGKLDRNLLFESTATKLDPVNRIARLLQEYQGVFVFLCQVSGAFLCNTCHKNGMCTLYQTLYMVCVSDNLRITLHYFDYTYNSVLFGRFCLFRHVLMGNLESSVGVPRMTRPSVLNLATPSVPISEPSISVIIFFCLSCRELSSFSSSSVPIRCLVFEAKSLSVTKVRPLSILCRLNLCAQSSHLSSQREDGCNYAHSLLELKTWMVQRDTGEDRQETQPSSTSQGATEALPTLRRHLEWFAAVFLCLHLQASATRTLWKYLQTITINTSKLLIEMKEIRYETLQLLLYSVTETSASDLRRNLWLSLHVSFEAAVSWRRSG